MDGFVDYLLGISFGFTAICAALFLLRKTLGPMKLAFCIVGFLFIRDSMTKYGLWEFGKADHAVWFRFIDNGFVLLLMAAVSFLLVVLLHRLVFKGETVQVAKQTVSKEVIAGVISAFVIALPFLMMYQGIPIEERGEQVAPSLLLPLFIFCLCGNSLEEYLFRGRLQPYFEKHVPPYSAVLLSALSFMIGHLWLASLITDMGLSILLFTFWEGLICALLARKFGLIACTFAHGGAIFLLSSGII